MNPLRHFFLFLAALLLTPHIVLGASASSDKCPWLTTQIDKPVYGSGYPISWKTHYDEILDISYQYPSFYRNPIALKVHDSIHEEDYTLIIYSLMVRGTTFKIVKYDLFGEMAQMNLYKYVQHSISRLDARGTTVTETRVAGLPALHLNYSWQDEQNGYIYFRRNNTMYTVVLPECPSKVVDKIISTIKFGGTDAEKKRARNPQKTILIHPVPNDDVVTGLTGVKHR